MKHFVNDGTSNLGPYTFAEICDLVKAGKLKTSYNVYLHEEGRWISIQEHPEFVKFNLSQNNTYKMDLPPLPVIENKVGTGISDDKTEVIAKPTQKTKSGKVTTVSIANTVATGGGIGEWYLLKSNERKGPFTFFEVIKLLQEKAAFEYDYVWRQGLENWTRIAEVPDFHGENIRRIMKSDLTKNQEIFFRRKHQRVNYECPIIAHDNKAFWTGYTIEIGEDGAGIVIENAMLMPGQNIYLHFKAGPQNKAFNVLCEVVNKKFIKNVRNVFTPMIYGVRFINIPKQEKDLIRSLSA